MPLKYLKYSNPVEVAQFGSARSIYSEYSCIIAAVIARTKRVFHKYGVQLPSTVQEAYEIDEGDGNTLWCDALNKGVEILKVAFDIFPNVKSPPVQYHKLSGHLIFYVRILLEHKAI